MDRGDVCTQFLERLEFDLYPFQEEALLAWFEAEQGVLVAAPTGMGKTLIAEAAIYEALVTGDRLYYTTPLIALTDQKFREFQDKAEDWGFRRDDVGLVTGNRKINPDARVRVVVAEILLNHLLGDPDQLRDVRGVVMDEFHYFNDFERGVVWELSLVLLPKHIRLMLLSATVGNSRQFLGWLSEKHDRKLRLVESQERRVPLEFCWVGDKLLTEQLPLMLAADDEANRAPALVFCFNREECWSVAERIKGVTLIDEPTRKRIDEQLDGALFTEGIGPKLKQMLLRGVAVHHAGVLPKYKEVVESLFLQKLIPFVICTETLAAGINLPARSVVLSELLKGKRGEKKLIAPSAAHQMFGRAGRPQFDKKGYVFALAHEDDVKIEKWRKKYEQIDPKTKDPGLLRAKKDLERKRPTRRKTEQYWTEGQFGTLIKAGPADLFSRSMIPYQVLIYLLLNTGSLQGVREFLSRRFNTPERLSKFQDQLDHMVKNLAAFGHLTVSEDGQSVQLAEGIESLLEFRSIDPLYGRFLAKTLVPASPQERLQALESVLPVPPVMSRAVRLPFLEPGPLQVNELEPTLLQLGIVITHEDGGVVQFDEDEGEDYMPDDRDEPRPMSLPEMLAALYQAKLASPEDVPAQPQWIVGGILEQGGDFYKYIRNRDLQKNEGLILRHLLRFVILAGEFQTQSGGDPTYQDFAAQVTTICQSVDPRYTERFLSAEEEAKKLGPV